jgi:hypothetical protein
MSDGYQIEKAGESLLISHGEYSAQSLVTSEAIRASAMRGVTLESGGEAVLLAFSDGRVFRLGPEPGMEDQGVMWAQRIGDLFPDQFVGDYAAKRAALYDALVALI